MGKYFKPYTRQCKGCSKRIAFLKTTTNRIIPVNIDSLSPQERTDVQNGVNFFFDGKRHISHFATCPKSDNFRRIPDDQLNIVYRG